MEKVINQKAQKTQFKYRETEIECSLILNVHRSRKEKYEKIKRNITSFTRFSVTFGYPIQF